MQRQTQKSILSFFKKPSPEEEMAVGESPTGRRPPLCPTITKKQDSAIASVSNQPPVEPSMEIRGTDTPPEKVPRPIFSGVFLETDETTRPSLFSNIMHKFVKVDAREMPPERNQALGGSANACLASSGGGPKRMPRDERASLYAGNDGVLYPNKSVSNGLTFHDESVDDVLGPETPGVRPGFKRIQGECSISKDSKDSSLQNSSKRLKLLQEPENRKEKQGDASDIISKFEWLQPSQIRDASKRRPGDALYDKRTLYIPPDVLKKMTASQRQYWEVKCQYMDVLLFFKVGKFYELYEIDAEIGHKVLDWKMTLHGVGRCRQVGISESGIDDAVQKLIAHGYKVGRMEQLETSDQAKARGANSVIQRKLINLTSPSTIMDTSIGPDAVHLLSIKEGIHGLENGSTIYGFAFVDCAALKFWIGSITDDASCASLGALLMQVSPIEVIHETGLSKEAQKALDKFSISGSASLQLTPVVPDTYFMDASKVRYLIHSKGYFVGSSDSWDHALNSVVDSDITLCALGGLISHLSRLMLDDALRNGDILPYEVYTGCLRMDGQTLVNLEIFSNTADGGPSGTLYKYLDNCVTSSGKRVLRKWICHPLKDVDKINDRLSVVKSLIENSEIMLLVAQYLQKLPDLERSLGRVKACIRSSAPLLVPLVGKKILKQRVKVFGSLVKGLRNGINLLVLLKKEKHIYFSLSKVLKLPVLSDSDALDRHLTQFEAAVDSDFPNYQDHEITETDAETLSILMELFVERATQWSQVIHAINCVDVLRSFAVTASFSSGEMSRPLILPHSGAMNEGPILKIRGLWHPFALAECAGLPVPNDIHLGKDTASYHPRALLLTGPNMGGKSTLLRATCLAVILAQLGCYVPCENCVLSLVDIIFTRLGATDRIMAGESTFLIECAETASVLQNATQDSLILLDELGRGTSTFDGYAIAYAVFCHLVEKVNCRLLFATHYHPLTKEFACHPRVSLQHMACSFKKKSGSSSKGGQELVFLYRLASGACLESYGMQVALMAGIPEQVVENASKAGKAMKELLKESFKSSEQRSEFSTLHEDWLKSLLIVSSIAEHNFDEDAFDTLFCLWHEMKASYKITK